MNDNQDKRRYLRYQIFDFAVAQLDGEPEPFSAMVVDIGLGGLQLRSRRPLNQGTQIWLRIGRLDESPLEIPGEVRHVDPVPDSDLFAIGVRFVPGTHEQRVALAEFVHEVFQRQRDRLLK